MNIYMIPGLGFDQRMFHLLDINTFDIEYINWIEPEKNESIQDYAKRLLSKIDDTHENIIIGHSFGGIIAQEIAKYKRIKKIILISSIKSRQELPFYFKIIKPLRVHKLFSKELALKTVKYWGGYHDYRSQEELELFKSMVRSQSNTYLQWALKALSNWQTVSLPKHTSLFQIHGTNDKTFPFRLIDHANFSIKDAGHFMVFKEKEKLKELIIGVLSDSKK